MKELKFTRLMIDGKEFLKSDLERLALKKKSQINIKSWEINFYDFIESWISETKSIKVKTSGSTGSPKWIEIEKEKMIRSALNTGEFLGLQKNDKSLLCLPVEYIAGKMMVIRSFVLGLNLMPVEPSGNPLEKINESFDFAAMIPMQVHTIFETSKGIEKLNIIKNLIIGGGEINFELKEKIEQLKNNTFHTYGMTETITHVAMKRLNGSEKSNLFKALPNVKFGKDKRGCLVIHSPNLSGKEIVTNDLVELANETEFDYKGRIDNVINSGGIKIMPEAVEEKLEPYLKNRFIIAGIADEKLGSKVVLLVEGSELKEDELGVMYKKSGLSDYEVPKQVFTVSRFPETATGKIIREKAVKMILTL